jgi:hypothetical protein
VFSEYTNKLQNEICTAQLSVIPPETRNQSWTPENHHHSFWLVGSVEPAALAFLTVHIILHDANAPPYIVDQDPFLDEPQRLLSVVILPGVSHASPKWEGCKCPRVCLFSP